MVRSMGKKRKGPGRKKLRAYVCVFMCALMLFQSAEPSSGAIAAPPGDALNEQDYFLINVNQKYILIIHAVTPARARRAISSLIRYSHKL